MKKFYAILCLAIASLTQLQAQAPQGFNYQATVRNSSGDLIVNTNVYFKFNVIQGSETSVPIFTETHYVPTDDLGQVNLVIGQGTSNLGSFSALDWSLGSYYLGIELDTGNGYLAMGTTQLLSVPYALYAENSGNSTPTTPNLEAVLAENNSANNQQIKDLQDPTDAQDAVTKAYIDALSNTQGLMNFNGWDNYQISNDNTTFQLEPNSFVFLDANNTTLIFPDGSENGFGDAIYIYVVQDNSVGVDITLQPSGFPIRIPAYDQPSYDDYFGILGCGLNTIINVGDYWMVADFQGSISNNLTAQVNPIDDVYFCPGDDVSVNFSTTNLQGTTQYLWTNDNDLIGIPLSGISTYFLQSPNYYIFTNDTSEPQVATITVTPELTFQGQTTTGPSETFTITVNPLGQVNQVADVTLNDGEAVQPIIFSTSNISGTTTYTWTNNTPSLGLPANGSGNIPSFTAINTTTTPIVGTITVTPDFTNGGLICDGPSISFTVTVNPAAGGTGTVTDQDGNSYDYLSYGNQAWTVENAEMVTYRDGTVIPQVTDPTQWSNLTTGAWCYYENDETKGKLYNWYAVMGIHDAIETTPNKEFAPEGWHVPTDTEWTTLDNHLIANGYNYDGTTTESKIAKAMASTTGWNSSTGLGAPGNDQSLNNSSGFNAFPEGYRFYNGSFTNEGINAFFWSSTEKENSTNNAWSRFLYNIYMNLHRYSNSLKQDGFSVRFVRD